MTDIKSVDIIIPTCCPDDKFQRLLNALAKQTYPIRKIIIMHTCLSGKDTPVFKLTGSLSKKIEIHRIAKKDFDHARTRDKGVGYSSADIFIMMTQDAVPKDIFLIENLVASLTDACAVSYARQEPDKNADAVRQFIQSFNYPRESITKSANDIERLGIKTYFCSNVCAAYNREIYNKAGGFTDRAIFNEDMIYAAKVIAMGYKVAYAANASVIHSHNYTFRQEFHRNFDIGVSQADNPQVFNGISSESEGIAMIKRALVYFFKTATNPIVFLNNTTKLIFGSMAKYFGYSLGKRYKRLPMSFVRRCTMNERYF